MRARLIHAAWRWGARAGTRRFREGLSRPAEAQARKLSAILALGEGSDFARAHGLHAALSVADFRRLVPIRTWDGFKPWLDAIVAGRQGALTGDPVTRLIPTSGSSDACKLVPSGRALLADFQAALEPWVSGMLAAEPRLRDCCSYWSISPPGAFARGLQAAFPIGFEPDTRYFGPLGAWMRSAQAVPQSVAGETDPARFRAKTLVHLLRRPDLGFVSVWHPSFFALLLDHLEADWDALLREVSAGGTSGADRERSLKGDPERARALRRMGPVPAGIWPRFKVLSAWSHASSEGPAKALAARLPGVRLIPKGLAATEGIVSLPWEGRHPLAITSHFLEFIDGRGEARLAHELEPGGEYEAVLTTSGGLWRMRTGDAVEAGERVGATPSIRFLGRLSQVSDLCGEKLHEAHVTRALLRLDGLIGGTAWRLVLPAADGKGYLLVLDRPPGDPGAVIARLESGLRENPHYRLAAEMGQLRPLALALVPPRADARLLGLLTGSGQAPGTAKPPWFGRDPGWLGKLAATSGAGTP
jgi:hypothetical protein